MGTRILTLPIGTSYMAGWRIHVAAGLGAVVATLFFLMWLLDSTPAGDIGFFSISLEALVIGSLAAMLGSLLPDVDLKGTKVRYVGGPILGGILAGMVAINGILAGTGRSSILDVTPREMILHIEWPRVAVIYMAVVVISLGIGFIPFTHRKRLHSVIAAGAYALFWAVMTIVLMNLTFIDVVVIIILSYLGYMTHLVLDGQVKTWKRPTRK